MTEILKLAMPQASDSIECYKNMDRKKGFRFINSALGCNFFGRKFFSIVRHPKNMFFQKSCISNFHFGFLCVSVLVCSYLLHATEEWPRLLFLVIFLVLHTLSSFFAFCLEK